MPFKDAYEEWKQFDENRPSLPGEHWLTAAAGAGLLVAATRTNCRVTAGLQALVGGALLLRAATGRDGLRSLCASFQGGQGGSRAESGGRSGADGDAGEWQESDVAGTDAEGPANPADPNLGRS